MPVLEYPEFAPESESVLLLKLSDLELSSTLNGAFCCSSLFVSGLDDPVDVLLVIDFGTSTVAFFSGFSSGNSISIFVFSGAAFSIFSVFSTVHQSTSDGM